MTGSAQPGRVTAILPAGVDDPDRPSGGNRYDRRVCDELRRDGWMVEERLVQVASAAELAKALRAPSGVVLVDALVAVRAPEPLIRAAHTHPVVVVAHMCFGRAEPALRRGEHTLLSQVHGIITPSRWLAGQLCSAYGLAAERVSVASPGVDPAVRLAAPSRAGSRLLCVATVTKAKGHDLLLGALGDLEDRDWQLTCAGALTIDPGFAAEQLAGARGLGGRVRFTGPLTGGALTSAYAEADLLVLASRSESWGMVVTEALAHGVPVLAAAVGGVPEALAAASAKGAAADGEPAPGLLVPPGDRGALARALDHWLTDAGLRARLSGAAHRGGARLPGWGRTAGQVAAVLRQAAQDHSVADAPAPPREAVAWQGSSPTSLGAQGETTGAPR